MFKKCFANHSYKPEPDVSATSPVIRIDEILKANERGVGFARKQQTW